MEGGVTKVIMALPSLPPSPPLCDVRTDCAGLAPSLFPSPPHTPPPVALIQPQHVPYTQVRTYSKSVPRRVVRSKRLPRCGRGIPITPSPIPNPTNSPTRRSPPFPPTYLAQVTGFHASM